MVLVKKLNKLKILETNLREASYIKQVNRDIKPWIILQEKQVMKIKVKPGKN